MHAHEADHHHGLPHDLAALLSRRRMLSLLGAAGAAALATRAEAQVCVAHPPETAGPFPADGSNRAHGRLANVLTDSGILRRDMRSNLDGSGAVAEGVELRLTITLVDAGRDCAPRAGHALYLWSCDAPGRYSIYDLPKASYLRAVGVSDAAGQIEFTTIVPGCYPGRYPHFHAEVYPSLAAATSYRNRILTTQLAVPADVCRAAYALPAYGSSAAHFARTSFQRDGIFADNTPAELAAQTLAVRSTASGAYEATVVMGLKARPA